MLLTQLNACISTSWDVPLFMVVVAHCILRNVYQWLQGIILYDVSFSTCINCYNIIKDPSQLQRNFFPRFYRFEHCIHDLQVFYTFFTVNRYKRSFALEYDTCHFIHLRCLVGDMRLR